MIKNTLYVHKNLENKKKRKRRKMNNYFKIKEIKILGNAIIQI